MARDFKKAAASDDGNVEVQNTLNCSAYGCPLVAGLSHGGGKWLCQAHFHAGQHHWHDVTQKIRADVPTVDLILLLRKAQAGDDIDMRVLLASLKERGRDDLLPNDLDRLSSGRLSLAKWSARIEQKFIADVTRGTAARGDVGEKKRSQGAMMEMAEKFMQAHGV